MIAPESTLEIPPGPPLQVADIRTAIIRYELANPIQYGQWRITHREFALVRVDTVDGYSGFAYGLTRDGPISEVISRSVTPIYKGMIFESPADAFYRCKLTSHAVLSAGTGMRALSLVDMAAWDALARVRGQSMTHLLGGEPTPRYATSIIGYPPGMSAQGIYDEVDGLHDAGWRRFKAPISTDLELTLSRMKSARDAARGGWLGFDFNYSMSDVKDVVAFAARLDDLNLGWIEDPYPPGDASAVAAIRSQVSMPVAVGDDQGGSYYPEALLSANAIDVLRVDITANGGVTGLAKVVAQASNAGIPISPHMFPHFHTRVLDGLGVVDYPAEWGVPGAGIHPMDDELEQPVLSDGVMEPLASGEGFGRVVNMGWVSRQSVFDPLEVLREIPEGVCV